MGKYVHMCVTHEGKWALKMKKESGTPNVTHYLKSSEKN